MSIETVITGYPDYKNVSFLEDLRTTLGGDIVAPTEGGPLPLPADLDPSQIGREVHPDQPVVAQAAGGAAVEAAQIPQQRDGVAGPVGGLAVASAK